MVCHFLFCFSVSCQQQPSDNKQASIDSLTKMIEWLKPGLGEFMKQLEYWRDKLGESIRDKNHEKAGLEVGERKDLQKK